jgi:hypothetical protein
MHPAVKADLRDISQAETRAAAETAADTFAEKYGAKYEKAVTCLAKDREALLVISTDQPLSFSTPFPAMRTLPAIGLAMARVQDWPPEA